MILYSAIFNSSACCVHRVFLCKGGTKISQGVHKAHTHKNQPLVSPTNTSLWYIFSWNQTPPIQCGAVIQTLPSLTKTFKKDFFKGSPPADKKQAAGACLLSNSCTALILMGQLAFQSEIAGGSPVIHGADAVSQLLPAVWPQTEKCLSLTQHSDTEFSF